MKSFSSSVMNAFVTSSSKISIVSSKKEVNSSFDFSTVFNNVCFFSGDVADLILRSDGILRRKRIGRMQMSRCRSADFNGSSNR